MTEQRHWTTATQARFSALQAVMDLWRRYWPADEPDAEDFVSMAAYLESGDQASWSPEDEPAEEEPTNRR
jgi:hypothetical protein